MDIPFCLKTIFIFFKPSDIKMIACEKKISMKRNRNFSLSLNISKLRLRKCRLMISLCYAKEDMTTWIFKAYTVLIKAWCWILNFSETRHAYGVFQANDVSSVLERRLGQLKHHWNFFILMWEWKIYLRQEIILHNFMEWLYYNNVGALSVAKL